MSNNNNCADDVIIEGEDFREGEGGSRYEADLAEEGGGWLSVEEMLAAKKESGGQSQKNQTTKIQKELETSSNTLLLQLPSHKN